MKLREARDLIKRHPKKLLSAPIYGPHIEGPGRGGFFLIGLDAAQIFHFIHQPSDLKAQPWRRSRPAR